MTDKSFYQAAAAEVAQGHLDDALWIKVGAEMPGADNVARQAKYIQLRAQEMAVERTKNRVRGFWPSLPWWGKLLIIGAVAFIAYTIFCILYVRSLG